MDNPFKYADDISTFLIIDRKNIILNDCFLVKDLKRSTFYIKVVSTLQKEYYLILIGKRKILKIILLFFYFIPHQGSTKKLIRIKKIRNILFLIHSQF